MYKRQLTTIGANAFSAENNDDKGKLTTLSLPSNVTTIGNKAFQNHSLTSLTLGSKVQSIGDYAFYGSEISNTITLPTTLTAIGELAFGGNQYTTLTIPANVTSIKSGAFFNNDKLTTLTIRPQSITFEAPIITNDQPLEIRLTKKLYCDMSKDTDADTKRSNVFTEGKDAIAIGGGKRTYKSVDGATAFGTWGSNTTSENKHAQNFATLCP